MVSDYVKMVTELNVSSLNTLHKLENYFTRLCLVLVVAAAFLAFGMRFCRRAFRTIKLNRLLVNVLDIALLYSHAGRLKLLFYVILIITKANLHFLQLQCCQPAVNVNVIVGYEYLVIRSRIHYPE